MQQQWFYNPLRGRFELWGNDGQGHVGIIQVAVHPASTHPDLQPGTPVVPLNDDDFALITRAQQGDSAALTAITNGLAQRNAALGGQAQGEGQGYGGVRQTAAQVNAYTNIVNSATDMRQAQDALQQKEYELRQKMAQAGQDPGYWFGQAASGQAGGVGETTAMPGVALDPDYINAYNSQNVAAGRAALLAQAERLQQVANAFGAHMEGADWLDKFGATNRALANAGADLAYNEHLADADPKQDKNLRPNRTGGWTHGGGGAGQLADARYQRDQMLAQRYPDQYMWEQQQRMARAGTEPYQNWTAPAQGVTPGEASGHVPWNPRSMSGYIPHEEEYQTYAQGGQIPAYVDGGATGADPGQTANSYSPEQKDSDFQRYQLEQWYQAQVQQAQQDAAAQMQQIQQSVQFQVGQLDQDYAQKLQAMQAQIPLIQQELARRSQAAGQQQANTQSVQTLQPLAAHGGVQTFTG